MKPFPSLLPKPIRLLMDKILQDQERLEELLRLWKDQRSRAFIRQHRITTALVERTPQKVVLREMPVELYRAYLKKNPTLKPFVQWENFIYDTDQFVNEEFGHAIAKWEHVPEAK